ncbi:MAG TPA: class I SAM-dependent methyltransferase [Anaerolineales bacterium]|nr:class I SAM-dependent methyltransferase [Anaerolineales bacterium]
MNLYETQYAALHFERAGLFRAIWDKYHCKDVLYPGCSVHITPSLYFPHVVYIDQNEAAAKFFANEKSVLEFINRNKYYKRSAYIRFIRQDYSRSLPLMEGKFDLLLSLFAGGIARSCARYLKIGGFLLTNNHQGDALDAANDQNLKLTAVVLFQKGSYSIVEDGLSEIRIPGHKSNDKYLKQADQGVEYIENEIYYVFERLR